VKVKGFWKVWKYTIGSFSDDKTQEYDNIIASIRSVIVIINVVTCVFITLNIVHNW